MGKVISNFYDDFNDADKVAHAVEDQWHYPTMIAAGFTPMTPSAVGFVRAYTYQKDDIIVTCNTGARSDYWSDSVGHHGWYSSLKTTYPSL